MIQVEKDHYSFKNYMDRKRWSSIYQQMMLITQHRPSNVLEIGPGPGILTRLLRADGLSVKTVDFDAGLKPDYIADVKSLPFADKSFDLVCAFQILEHLDYGDSLKGLKEIERVAKKMVVISLPDCREVWRYKIHIPKIGERCFIVDRPFWRPPVHKFDGEHYWEVNKMNYSIDKIITDFSTIFSKIDHWRLWDNPYHRFFLMSNY